VTSRLSRNGRRKPARPTRRRARTNHGWDVRVLVPGLPLQATSVLLQHGRERIVVDTGFPTHDSVIEDALQTAGLTPAQITGVINTHFHLDHIGCNLLFKNAWVYGSRRDYEWALQIYESVCGGETRRTVFRRFYPDVTDEDFDLMDEARVLQFIQWMWDPAILGDLDRYRWIEDRELELEGLAIVPTPGHTPGHISLEVQGSDGLYLIAGDARPFATDASGPDMPPHNHREFQRSQQLISQFDGVVIPGHDSPFPQAAPAADAESPELQDREAEALPRR
jgi:glyoxylase-like metal-dependent hydrolase (beta-lactamase superfamily II)